MKIKKMTACFGRLQNETLTLKDGLNVIQLPNEAGKSTWTEFLLAMLYGVDSGERKKGNQIPIKEKYRPWSGGEMSGTVELEADGRDLTIERSSTARAQMAKFRAFETVSGLPVDLDGTSCGQTLLHAERSVYERSGLIRQQQLTVTQDAALEQKLASLVTTGDEEMAYSHVEQQLRKLKNACKHNKTGLIPETEQALAETRRQLAQLGAVQQTMQDAAAKRQSLQQEQAELRHAAEVAQALAAQRRQARVTETEAELKQAEQALLHAEQQCALLPSEPALRSLLEGIDRNEREAHELDIRRSVAPSAPQKPVLPPALQDVPPESVSGKAEDDLARCQALRQTPAHAGRLPLLLALLALLGAAALLVFGSGLLYVAAGVLLAGCGALTALYIINNRKAKQAAAAAREEHDRLLRSWNAADETALPALAEAAKQALEDYAAQLAAQQAGLAQLEAEADRIAQQRTELLAQVDAFGAKTEDLKLARQSVETALQTRASVQSLQLRTAQLQSALADRRALVGRLTPVSDEDAARYATTDPASLAAALGRCEARLADVQSELDTANGRLSAMGDRLALEAEAEAAEARLAVLEQKNAALALALDTLAEANRDLQSRFSPLVCQRAQELFARLTGGRYERVLLASDLSVSVQEPNAPVTRLLQLLSAGTVDQLYLALRLAISELLLPGAPLVLDDALVAFDDERALLALQVLREEAAHRQILLFTCQSREAQLLRAMM